MALTASGLRARLPAILAMEIPPPVGGLVIPYLVIRVLYRRSLRDFGVRWLVPGRRALPWFLGASAATVAAWTTVWVVLFGALALLTRSKTPLPFTLAEFAAKNPLSLLLDPGTPSTRRMDAVGYVVHVFLTVGFAEELFGRGLLVNALEVRYGDTWGRAPWTVRKSTVLASVLFAAWHIQWLSGLRQLAVTAVTSMTIVIVPSFLLCLVYEKTRSLAVTIALHNVIDGGKLLVWYLVGGLFVG
jgi:membrane protease YdiL (CAAX protease family)